LEFEDAALYRNEIRRLEAHELGLDKPGVAPRLALAATGAGTREKARAATEKNARAPSPHPSPQDSSAKGVIEG
jgi:excinuclease ABC subunit B